MYWHNIYIVSLGCLPLIGRAGFLSKLTNVIILCVTHRRNHIPCSHRRPLYIRECFIYSTLRFNQNPAAPLPSDRMLENVSIAEILQWVIGSPALYINTYPSLLTQCESATHVLLVMKQDWNALIEKYLFVNTSKLEGIWRLKGLEFSRLMFLY